MRPVAAGRDSASSSSSPECQTLGGRHSACSVSRQCPGRITARAVGLRARIRRAARRARRCQTFGEKQFACVVIVQAPDGAQQAAQGAGQGFGMQDVHSECHTAGSEHPASVVTVQFPFAAQQGAVGGCGQGFGEQLVHSLARPRAAGSSTGPRPRKLHSDRSRPRSAAGSDWACRRQTPGARLPEGGNPLRALLCSRHPACSTPRR